MVLCASAINSIAAAVAAADAAGTAVVLARWLHGQRINQLASN